MRIGLYFGSFNPIHIGHLIIANHVLNHCDLDRVWFVVSPHNPLKESASLLNESHRLHLVQLAIENESKFKASNVEFKLPRPSFTIDTMTHLTEKYPEHSFSIIMGSDSFQNIKKWKNYSALLQQFQIIIYNRPNSTIDLSLSNKLQVVNAPLLDISSTYIRNLIKERKSIRYLVTDEVMNDIKQMGIIEIKFQIPNSKYEIPKVQFQILPLKSQILHLKSYISKVKNQRLNTH